MAKRTPTLSIPKIQLGPASGVTLHRRIYLALRELILGGQFRNGERLPSSRTLAKSLGVSRNTVLNAYNRLADEGRILAKVGSGTSVANGMLLVTDESLLQPAIPLQTLGCVARILERSHYPIRHAAFQDWDGNALYVYDPRYTP